MTEIEAIEKKIRDEVRRSREKNPMLRIIKNNDETKFGEFMQLGNVEGGGRAFLARTSKVSIYPLIEVRDVEYIPKSMACEIMSRGYVFD